MRTKLDNLQGLRGVACLLVLGVHAGGWESDFGVSREFLRPFRWFGFAGVDLFFVISGFIIAHTQAGSFGNARAIPGYLFRRFWRVYPLFWITMLIAVPAISAALTESGDIFARTGQCTGVLVGGYDAFHPPAGQHRRQHARSRADVEGPFQRRQRRFGQQAHVLAA